MFAAFGIGLAFAVTKHVAASRENDPQRAGRTLWLANAAGVGLGVLLSVTVAECSGFLAREVLNDPGMATNLRLGCGLLLFNVVATIQNGSLAGLEDFQSIATVNLCRGLIGLPVIYGLTVLFGVQGAVIGLVITAGAGCVLGERAIRRACASRFIRRSSKGASIDIPALWRFSAVLLVCDLIGPPCMWLANTIVVRQRGGYSEMGVFSASMDWLVVAMALPSLITSALLPVTSALHAERAHQKYARFTRQALLGIAVLSFTVSSALALLAPAIVVLYGKSFGGRFNVLALLLCSAALANVSNAMRAIAISSDRQWGILASFVAYGGAVVGMTFWLRQDGADGRAWAHLIADGTLFAGLALVTAGLLRTRPGDGLSVREKECIQ